MPLSFRHGHYGLMGVLQVMACFLGRHGPRLQQQYARDNLQAVATRCCISCVLLTKPLLGFRQEIAFLPLRRSTLSYIDKRQKDGRTRGSFVDDLSRIEQHRPLSKRRKIVLHLETIHGDLSENNRFKKIAQRGNVSLTVIEREEQAARVCTGSIWNVS